MQQPFCVYIAAASTPDQIERVTTWANRLTKAGIAVVSTWPSAIANDQGGITNPRDASVDARRRWSAQDLAEVASADALWLMCPPSGGSTRGASTCQRCGGVGTEPAQPPRDPLADRALLRRAVQILEDDGAAAHARALRTLLERLDGAP